MTHHFIKRRDAYRLAPAARPARHGRAALAIVAMLALAGGWGMAQAQAQAQAHTTGPQVVGDGACPYYADDMAAFATCEGDRVVPAAMARPHVASAAESAQRVAVVTRRTEGTTAGPRPIELASAHSFSPKRGTARRRP